MSGNFFLRICNSTFNDIVKMEVIPRKISDRRMSPYDFECLQAGRSCEYQLMRAWNGVEKALCYGLFPVVASAVAIGSFFPFTLEVTVTFENGSKDKFEIELKRSDNTFRRFQHVTEAHLVGVEGEEGDERIVVTLRNTVKQQENQQAERLHEEGRELMFEGRCHEAAEKFNEAYRKSNEEDTKRKIQMYITKLEIEMDESALRIHGEGERMLNSDCFDIASGKFQEALRFAKYQKTISLVNESIEVTREKRFSERRSEDCMREAEVFMCGEEYVEALRKLEQALTFAKKRFTISVIMSKIDGTRRMQRNEERSSESRNRAERLLTREQYREGLRELEEALSLATKSETIRNLRRMIDGTVEMISSEEKSEEIVKEAERLPHQKALKKLEEALRFAKKKTTTAFITKKKRDIQQIMKDEERSQELNRRAQTLLKSHRYDEALEIFNVALNCAHTAETRTLTNDNIIKTADAKRRQEESERINHEAETLMADHRYEDALTKLAQASRLAQKTETIKSINNNKAKAQEEKGRRDKSAALNQKGEASLSEAFRAEEENRSAEARRKFDTARCLFKEARDLWPDTNYEKNYNLVDVKIKGNECYNAAVNLEERVGKLKKEMKTEREREDVVAGYVKAQGYYERAVKLFGEGAKMDEEKLQRSVRLAEDGVSGVGEMLKKLDADLLDFLVDRMELKTPYVGEGVTLEEDSSVVQRNCYVQINK